MGLLDTQKKTGGLLGGASAPTPAPISKDAMDFFAPSFSKGPSLATAQSTSPTPTGPDTMDFLRTTGQAIARNYIAVGQGIVNVATQKDVPFTPSGRIQTALFGTDKPISLQSVGEEYPFVPHGSTFAPAIAGFGVVLDLFGAGEAKGVTLALKNAKTAEEAAKILRTAGFADDIIKDYSPIFAGLRDTKKIDATLKTAQEAHNLEAAKVADVNPEITQMTREGTLSTERAQKALTEWETHYADDAARISDEVSSLSNDLKAAKAEERGAIQAKIEALNTKAAELEDGFLAKWGGPDVNGGTFFHGADAETAALIRSNGFRGSTDFPGSGMVSLTKNSNEASGYAHLTDKPGEVLPVRVNGNRVKEYSSLKEYTDAIEKAPGKTAGEKEMNLNKDFDIVRVKDETGKPDLVFANPKSVEIVDNLSATPTREPMAPGVPGEAEVRPTSSTLPERTLPQSESGATSLGDVSSLESVNQLPPETARPFAREVGIGAKNTSQPTLFARTMKKIDNGFTKVIEYLQDDKIRVQKLLEGKGLKVTDASNPYQKMTLYPGRVATKIEEAHAKIETMADDMVSLAHDTKRDVSEVRADVNEYLQASHAPERNAVLGDGAAGMTDAQAKAVLERIEGSPGAAEIKAIAKQARDVNYEGLMLLRDSGVISDDLFRTLTTRYKSHVPLQRLFEDEADVGGALSVRGFDVKSSGIKRAKGSEREVDDILGNIQHNYEQAVIRSEKNIVDQATLGFVRANREALSGLMEVRQPKAIGKTFDDKIIMERTTDPSYLQMFENGKPVWVKINDPALAMAIRSVNREKLPSLLHTVGAFTRFYAGLATRFNPEFAFPNKIRDLQETMIYMAAQKDVGFKGAARMLTRDPGSIRAVFDGVTGLDTPGARVYKEMKDLGGTTGGFGLSTRKQTKLDLEEMFATAQSKPRQAAENVIEYIDKWNTIFEDSTRLSVYKQALAQGASKERAAALAKEASINFNKMGRGGPVVNAIWMFANASIQGSAKMIRSLKNPKVLAAVVATVSASVSAINQWNDHIDPDWRNKVTKWDRLNGLPIILPNDKGEGVSYVVIPVSWGMKPIKVMADYAYDVGSGLNVDPKMAVSDFFSSLVDAYNPLGGTDLVSAFTPTVLDVPVEVVRNQAWSGSKIHPDFDKNAPRDIQYFDSLGQTATGRAFIEGTKELQKKTGIALSPADMAYAFEQYIGGAGKSIEKTVNAALGLAGVGEPVKADEYPFISRFYRTRTQEEVGQGAAGENELLKGMLQSQSRENFYKNQGAEDQYAKLKAMPKAEADAAWKQLVKDDPETAKKIMQLIKDDKKGLNYKERLINQLGVKDGSRATYLKGKFDELKTPEEKAALWKDYVEKGIITRQVADQIEWLMKHPPDEKQAKAGGGFEDMLAALTGAKTAYAHDKPMQKYYIRNNTITQDDLEEAKAVLFGEVSNRPSDKQMLEAQTILNTAFNRMDAYRKKGINKTLTEVLRQPNQYQAYGGKEYHRYKSGELRQTDEQKLEAIDAMLARVKNGTFQNNIGDYVFYSHKPDGRIVAVNKPLFL